MQPLEMALGVPQKGKVELRQAHVWEDTREWKTRLSVLGRHVRGSIYHHSQMEATQVSIRRTKCATDV